MYLYLSSKKTNGMIITLYILPRKLGVDREVHYPNPIFSPSTRNPRFSFSAQFAAGHLISLCCGVMFIDPGVGQYCIPPLKLHYLYMPGTRDMMAHRVPYYMPYSG